MKNLSRYFFSALFFLAYSHTKAQGHQGENQTIDTIISFWPFVVILVLLLLAILWYQQVKNMQRVRQRGRHRPAGVNPLVFLGIVSVFVVVLLGLPLYLNNLTDKKEATNAESVVIAPENRIELVLMVEGMTCTGCENAIQKMVKSLPGIESVKADRGASKTRVVFDKTLVDEQKIKSAISQAGYTVALKPD